MHTMPPFRWPRLLHALTVVAASCVAGAQQLPENTCGQIFQYVRDGGGNWFGELTLRLASGHNRLDLRFSQRGMRNQADVGRLQPYPNEATLRDDIRSGRTVKFRLGLRPEATGLLPKLTQFALNGVEQCTANEYGPPNSYFNRFYQIQVSMRQTPQFGQLPAFPGRQQPDVVVLTQTYESGSSWVQSQPIPVAQPPRTFVQVPVPAPTTVTWPSTQTWPAAPPTTATAPVSSITPQRGFFPPAPAQVPTNTPVFSCGREGTLTPFIHKGQPFPRGKYPWLTAIFHKESLTLAFKCGGSLLSNSKVITAAHCVYKMKEDRVLVSLGRYDLENYYEDGAEVREVMRINSHPQFSTRVLADADIAVLTLERPVVFNNIISPICLWEEAETIIPAAMGTIAGWGTDEHGNSMTRYPQVSTATIASDAECERNWRIQKTTTNRTLCAGNLDGSGPCLGDSGGGLMVKRNNRWLLRGIVSLGERGTAGQCNLNQYVLYCDLAKHLSWLLEHLA